MRSVIVHLTNVDIGEVKSFLNKNYPMQSSPWIKYKEEDPVLYIEIYDNFEKETQQEEIKKVCNRLGDNITVSVIADISGKFNGTSEINDFVNILLSKFEGVAQDDYTNYFWKLNEIQNGIKIEEHHFFDCKGWYEQNQLDKH